MDCISFMTLAWDCLSGLTDHTVRVLEPAFTSLELAKGQSKAWFVEAGQRAQPASRGSERFPGVRATVCDSGEKDPCFHNLKLSPLYIVSGCCFPALAGSSAGSALKALNCLMS